MYVCMKLLAYVKKCESYILPAKKGYMKMKNEKVEHIRHTYVHVHIYIRFSIYKLDFYTYTRKNRLHIHTYIHSYVFTDEDKLKIINKIVTVSDSDNDTSEQKVSAVCCKYVNMRHTCMCLITRKLELYLVTTTIKPHVSDSATTIKSLQLRSQAICLTTFIFYCCVRSHFGDDEPLLSP